MYRRIVLCLVAIVAMGSSTGVGLAAQAGVAPPPARSQFLWKVASATATVYLFGTMHVGKPDMLPPPGSVRRAFDAIAKLFVEIDPEEMSNLDPILMAQKEKVYMPGFKGGLALYSPEGLRKLEQIGGKEGLTTYDALQPWMVGLGLGMRELAAGEYTAEFGVDRWLIKTATEHRKIIHSLETAAFQLGVLFSLYPQDLSAQAAELEASLENWDAESKNNMALAEAYRAGDFGTLEIAFLGAFDQTTQLGKRQFKALIVDRNLRMAEKVKELLAAQGTSMVAVGAGHMVGSQGIVQVLRNEGFTVTAE